MLKILFYTLLLIGGSYFAATKLPVSYKEKILSATGLGEIKGKTFSILNPAAKRAELLGRLTEKLGVINNAAKEIKSADTKTTSNMDEALADSQEIISQLQELNPKTGLAGKAVGKIFGLGSPSPAVTDQITPDLKAEICK